MQGSSLVAPEVLARYAADAAREIRGVHALVGRHDGVKVTREQGRLTVEVHVSLEWEASAPHVGVSVQERVIESLARLTDVRPDAVDVVISEWHSASPR